MLLIGISITFGGGVTNYFCGTTSRLRRGATAWRRPMSSFLLMPSCLWFFELKVVAQIFLQVY